MADFLNLPANLPVPSDDGAAKHLFGRTMPNLTLPSTAGDEVELAASGPQLTVLYIYPLSGRPGVDLPEGWDSIPGARGCTPEACGFRDHFSAIQVAGAERLLGLSSQSTDYQAEFAERLGLPFPLLSDTRLELARALNLPTFTVQPQRLYTRLTLVLRGSEIEHVFYPVFPPDEHAAEVLGWIRERNASNGPGAQVASDKKR
jgi:peroxiredoxin